MTKCLSFCAVICCVLLWTMDSAVFAEEQAGGTGGSAVEHYKKELDALYQKAEELKENGDYDSASAILVKLMIDNPGVVKYELGYVDVLLEQSKALKEAKRDEWKAKANEAKPRLKSLYHKNTGNPDYYYLHAKYSWIVEASREAHITKALEKAFYYRKHFPEAKLLKADYLFDRALNTDADGQQPSRRFIAEEARASYRSALDGNGLSVARRAYALLKLGELDLRLFGDKEAARQSWEKAVAEAPASPAGRRAKERLAE